MAENTPDFQIDFSKFTDYTAYTGEGGSDLFPNDGLYDFVVRKLEPYFTKPKDGQPAKPAVKVYLTAEDADAKGLRMIADVLCGGTDKNGDDLGRQFMDFLNATGTSEEKIQANAKAGQKPQISALIPSLVGKKVIGDVQGDRYEGRERSKVRGWRSREAYDQAKAVGAHRRPRTVATGGTPGGAAVVNYGGAANGTAAAPTGSSSVPLL